MIDIKNNAGVEYSNIFVIGSIAKKENGNTKRKTVFVYSITKGLIYEIDKGNLRYNSSLNSILDSFSSIEIIENCIIDSIEAYCNQ